MAASAGPGSEDPAREVAPPEEWPACLRGAVVEGWSLVLYEGGGVEQLAACAERRRVAALYVLDGGEWVAYIPGAPDLVNAAFAGLYSEGVPPLTPLVARSEQPPPDGDDTSEH